jgi:mersacidin/lichenicidin family type 2 lantibiotic
MDSSQLIRAWRDPVYRASLHENELRTMSRHPAGEIVDSGLLFGERCEDAGDERITGTAGCTSIGCTRIVCTDPCSPLACDNTNPASCTLGNDCHPSTICPGKATELPGAANYGSIA